MTILEQLDENQIPGLIRNHAQLEVFRSSTLSQLKNIFYHFIPNDTYCI